MIYICSLFLIVFPIMCIALEKWRINYEGPFSTPVIADYSFETFHLLVQKINKLITKNCIN